ncbi:MAG: HEAT repeat domain-containing protein, partial [Candidatus Lokiarchaeota archaeon]|nr:HEAT repeat domain-containing protein [Candidatus Lokiarchaeota archaeon]
ASNRAYPGIKKFQNPVSNMMGLIKLAIGAIPIIIAAYGLYSSISAVLEGGATPKTGTSAYLSLLTTVVFGIMGFFSRFWNKKSKTKSIDFVFSGYIMVAIMLNILINFMSLNSAQVLGQFNDQIPFIGDILGSIRDMLTQPAYTLPIITLQNIITVAYALIILFQKNSDFQANIRLGAVIGAYQMASDKNLGKLKKMEEKLRKKITVNTDGMPSEVILKGKAPDYVTILKSIVLEPGLNKFGVDVNEPVRAKARQYLALIAQQKATKQADIDKIVAYLQAHTVAKERTAKHSFLSPEAFLCLGEIGKKHPTTVLDPLLDNLSGGDLLKKRYILNALGLMGGQTGKIKEILSKQEVHDALASQSYDVKNAAVLSIVDIGLELNDIMPVLDVLYELIDDAIAKAQPLSEHFVETLLQSLLKLCIKQPASVEVEKFIGVLDFKPPRADVDALNFILHDTLRILAYLAHYSPNKIPVKRIIELATTDARSFIRYIACDILGNLLLVKPEPEILSVLVKGSLADPDDDVRAMCNESITEYCTHTDGESETVVIDGKHVGLLDHYIARLDDADAFTAENASEALKTLAREYSTNIYKRLEPKIAGDNEELVRDCVYVLSTLDDDVMKSVSLDLLYKRLEDTSDATRAEIIRLLGYLGQARPDVDMQIVAKFLSYTKAPEVRLNAIFAMGKIGTKQPANATGLLLNLLGRMNKAKRSLELELVYEALGVIGSVHPFDEIITTLEQSIMGDMNPFSKDVVAKALKSIGQGLIESIGMKKERKTQGTYKMTRLPGNIVMIFLNALQLKGIPDEVIDIISDGIQDLLPYFLIAGDAKKPFEYLDTLHSFLVQAYNSNFSHEILETMDRIHSLKAFKLYVDEEKSLMVKASAKFYAKQYTPDGVQFYDQGMLFKALGQDRYALASFEIALELDPTEYFAPRCHQEIGSIVQATDAARAMKEYQIASDIFLFFDDIAGMKECAEKMAALRSK